MLKDQGSSNEGHEKSEEQNGDLIWQLAENIVNYVDDDDGDVVYGDHGADGDGNGDGNEVGNGFDEDDGYSHHYRQRKRQHHLRDGYDDGDGDGEGVDVDGDDDLLEVVRATTGFDDNGNVSDA